MSPLPIPVVPSRGVRQDCFYPGCEDCLDFVSCLFNIDPFIIYHFYPSDNYLLIIVLHLDLSPSSIFCCAAPTSITGYGRVKAAIHK